MTLIVAAYVHKEKEKSRGRLEFSTSWDPDPITALFVWTFSRLAIWII